MSTKSTCNQLARAAYGELASVGARRNISTWWVVEVFDGAGRVLLSEEDRSLRIAYARVAIQLRVLGDPERERSCGFAVHIGNDKWCGCVLGAGHAGAHETERAA